MQSLGAVEQEAKSELELELLAAAPLDLVEVAVGCGRRDPQDVEAPLPELGGEPFLHLRGER